MTCADSPPADDDAILAVCLTAALYHGAVAEKPAPGRSRAGATAQHVATIIQAAEDAAQAMRTEAEQRVNQRIAEGERAAQYRVQAAEEEAVETVEAAQEGGPRRQEGQRARRGQPPGFRAPFPRAAARRPRRRRRRPCRGSGAGGQPASDGRLAALQRRAPAARRAIGRAHV